MNVTIQIKQSDGVWGDRAVHSFDFVDEEAYVYLRHQCAKYLGGAINRTRAVSDTGEVMVEAAGAYNIPPLDVLNNPLRNLQQIYKFSDEEMKQFIAEYRKK